MAHTAQRAHIDPDRLRAIQAALRERDLDGWLLYDYHATNPIAGRVLGLPQPLSRRYFVLIPVEGKPVAVVHSLERPPWRGWIGSVRVYFRWQELERTLAELLTPGQRIAIEYSETDRIPQLDRVPAGVLDLVKRAGVHPVESGELATMFASAWTDAELESHRRAARALANAAARAFEMAAAAVSGGRKLSEWSLKEAIVAMTAEAGLAEADAIVAVGPNAADGHYEPTPADAAPVLADRVLLIDLWAREPDSVWADQTWMAFTGAAVPPDVERVWRAVREARDAAVRYIETAMAEPDRPLRGCDVDAASRSVIERAGYGERFNHRTGHSIDSGDRILHRARRVPRGRVRGPLGDQRVPQRRRPTDHHAEPAVGHLRPVERRMAELEQPLAGVETAQPADEAHAEPQAEPEESEPRGLLLRCVLRCRGREPRLARLVGPPEAELVPHGGLGALVHAVPYRVPDWSPELIREHSRVVERAWRRGTVVPAPYGIVFRDRDQVVEFLTDQRVALEEALAFLDGAFELRLHVRPSGYRSDAEDPEIADRVAGFYSALRRRSRAAFTFPATPPRILSAAFLVDRADWVSFVEYADELDADHPEYHFDLTGPWPPFDFVTVAFFPRVREGD